MDVSIVIVNWNTKELLRDCLNSIYEQAGEIDYEIIVVDNASTDGSAEMVKRNFPHVTLIENSENRGYAAGVNQGVAVAKGRYVLVLNSDTIVCDNAIEKTMQYADKHPEAAVVGCQVWEDSDTVQMTCFRFPSVLNLFLDMLALSRIFKKNRFFGRAGMWWWLRDSEREVDVVSGMFMLVRHRAVDEVGLMDELYFLLCEETDWCYRFSKAGWKRIFWPGAKIIHVDGGSQSRKKANLKMMVQFQKSILIFFRKHYSLIEYLLARVLLAVHCGLRCVAWGFLTLCKKLVGKDATYQVEKTRGFWLSFKFCVLGCEPGAKAEGKITRFRLGTLKDIIEFISALPYWAFLYLSHRKPQRIVIYYHTLKQQDVGRFEKQMAYLATECCTVKVSEIMTAPPNGSKVIVGVTFDDAFVSFRDNALPILQKYRLPAAVSVPTGNLGKPPNWALEGDCHDANEIVMNKEQLVELDKTGYEILSHTVSHPYLTRIDNVKLEDELERSKQTLERIVGHDIFGISYPHGAHNDKVCKAAERFGYQIGFCVEPYSVDSSPNSFQIGRFRVSPTDSMLKFKLKLIGAYEIVKYFRRIKRMLFRP